MAAALPACEAPLPPVTPVTAPARPAPSARLPQPVAGLALEVLVTGAIELDGKALLDPARPEVTLAERGRQLAPAVAYLIHHPTAGNYLVDTGFGPAFVRSHTGDLGWYTAASVQVEVGPGEDLVSRLAQHGLAPKDIKAVVLTHAHVDHTGGLPALGHLPVYVARDELRMLDRTLPLLEGVKRDHFANISTFEAVDFDHAPVSPLLGRAVDLLGDGSIWLLDTRGHTPGHLSVLVNLPQGPVLLAGDAVQTRHGLAAAIPSGHSLDARQASVAAAFVRQLAQTLHARVYCGHDREDAVEALR